MERSRSYLRVEPSPCSLRRYEVTLHATIWAHDEENVMARMVSHLARNTLPGFLSVKETDEEGT
jgi:hypothetical protein